MKLHPGGSIRTHSLFLAIASLACGDGSTAGSGYGAYLGWVVFNPEALGRPVKNHHMNQAVEQTYRLGTALAQYQQEQGSLFKEAR